VEAKMLTGFEGRKIEVKYLLEDLGVERRIILK
jgi:hypothetical protein